MEAYQIEYHGPLRLLAAMLFSEEVCAVGARELVGKLVDGD